MKGELWPITFHWSHLLMLLPWILSFSTACRGIQLFMPWNCPGMDNLEEWGSQHHVEQTFYQRILESVNIVLFSFSEQNLIKDKYMKSLLKNSNRKTYIVRHACCEWWPQQTHTLSCIVPSWFFLLSFPHCTSLRLYFLIRPHHASYVSGSASWTFKVKNIWNTYMHEKMHLGGLWGTY